MRQLEMVSFTTIQRYIEKLASIGILEEVTGRRVYLPFMCRAHWVCSSRSLKRQRLKLVNAISPVRVSQMLSKSIPKFLVSFILQTSMFE